jgi:hypothetical protein
MLSAIVKMILRRGGLERRTGDQRDVAVGADMEPWSILRAASRAVPAHSVEIVDLAGKVRRMPHRATWRRSGRLGARSPGG